MAHLALVTLWQSGEAEAEYDDYEYGYGRGYHWSDDEDEDEINYNGTTSDYEMGEIYDDSLSADHWSDRYGAKLRFGEIQLDEGDIVSRESLEKGDPNSEDFEGYTGNAGMTLERWYHSAAIVIWPREKHFEVLCAAGTDAAIGGLQAEVKRLKRTAKTKLEKQRRECLTFAREIIGSWESSQKYLWDKTGGMGRSVFPSLLQELGDPDLVRRFLSQIMVADGQVQIDKSFGKFCKQYGWPNFAVELTTVIEDATAATINRNAELLSMLCLQRDKNAERLELCAHLAERAVAVLEAYDQRPCENGWMIREIDRSALLASLVTAMLAVDALKPLSRLIDHALAQVEKYDLTKAHLAAIFGIESRLAKLPAANRPISNWLGSCRQELENRTTQAPQKPVDYRRANKLSCNCNDCRELSAFLANPDQRQGRFSLAKPRRRHLHQIIDGDNCDLTHETERQGRPYTLVCTKNTASYQAACKIHKRDLRNLSRINALEKQIG